MASAGTCNLRRVPLVVPPGLAEPLCVFAVTRATLFVLAFVAQMWLPMNGKTTWHDFPGNYWLDGWLRWDSGWYLTIAAHGYSFDPVTNQGSVAFFPLYPLLIRGLGVVVGSQALAALVISNVAFAVAVVVLFRLASHVFDTRTARWTLLFLCAFPFAYFFVAAYTESLFLCLSALSFYLAERERWWLSGLVGVFAGLTRSIGSLVGPAIFLIYLRHRGYNHKRLDRHLLAAGLAPLGTFLYMAYLYVRFHDPLAFARASFVGWGHYNVFVEGLSRLNPWGWNVGNYDLVLFTNVALVLLWLLLSIPAFRLLGPGYALFTIASAVIPFSGATESLGRYVLPIFPGFIVMAVYLKDATAGKLVLYGSAMLLALLTALFANWYWVI